MHAAGIYESRGRFIGLFLGDTGGALFGRYRGTSQNRLSASLNPPRRLPYAAPIVLWLMGFFILMSFDARDKLSWAMAVMSVLYVFLLPVYLLGSIFYNLALRPKKFREWQRKFMCQRCGTIAEVDKFARSSSEHRGQNLADSGSLP